MTASSLLHCYRLTAGISPHLFALAIDAIARADARAARWLLSTAAPEACRLLRAAAASPAVPPWAAAPLLAALSVAEAAGARAVRAVRWLVDGPLTAALAPVRWAAAAADAAPRLPGRLVRLAWRCLLAAPSASYAALSLALSWTLELAIAAVALDVALWSLRSAAAWALPATLASGARTPRWARRRGAGLLLPSLLHWALGRAIPPLPPAEAARRRAAALDLVGRCVQLIQQQAEELLHPGHPLLPLFVGVVLSGGVAGFYARMAGLAEGLLEDEAEGRIWAQPWDPSERGRLLALLRAPPPRVAGAAALPAAGAAAPGGRGGAPQPSTTAARGGGSGDEGRVRAQQAPAQGSSVRPPAPAGGGGSGPQLPSATTPTNSGGDNQGPPTAGGGGECGGGHSDAAAEAAGGPTAAGQQQLGRPQGMFAFTFSAGTGDASKGSSRPPTRSAGGVPSRRGATRGGGLCCVCLDREWEILLAPCGHACLCEQCRDRLFPEDAAAQAGGRGAAGGRRRLAKGRTCPLCREPVTQTVKVRGV